MGALAAVMAAFIWIAAWIAIIALFGVNGLILAGAIHVILLFGLCLSYAVNNL